MALIGIRELREQTAEVIRRVREERVEYIITHQGRPVAILQPINEAAVDAAIHQASKGSAGDPWEKFWRLMDELRSEWPAGVDGLKVLDDIRRDD
jgi:prevent-host-death family protein